LKKFQDIDYNDIEEWYHTKPQNGT
jgi:hypothetical protein